MYKKSIGTRIFSLIILVVAILLVLSLIVALSNTIQGFNSVDKPSSVGGINEVIASIENLEF